MTGGTGHCLCGAVRFAFDGAPIWQVHCHCESCRRATAAPFTSFLGVDRAGFRWTGAAPVWRQSSARADRAFCGACGTPMAYQSHERQVEIDLYAATLDRAADYAPTAHVHWGERMPWIVLADGLPVRRAPRRLTETDDPGPVLDLIRAAFAPMSGVIDPPSSADRLTPDDVARQAATGEVWVLDEPGGPIACLFLTRKGDAFYLGKLAVAGAFQRQGLARQLVSHAEARARAEGLGALELQTRVELGGNHAAFRALGFVETGRSAHAGYDRPTSIAFRKTVGPAAD